MHGTILNQIHALGYAVSVHRLNGTVEMHAVLLRDPDVFHVARCNDGEGGEEAYPAACLLARACGIELEDG